MRITNRRELTKSAGGKGGKEIITGQTDIKGSINGIKCMLIDLLTAGMYGCGGRKKPGAEGCSKLEWKNIKANHYCFHKKKI